MNKSKCAPLLLAVAVFLAGCGDGSDTTVRLHQAYLDHPDMALEIAPNLHLDALSPVDIVPGTEGALKIKVASLQADYETKFCQLNSEHKVTLDAPECKANIAYIKKQTAAGNFDLSAKPIERNAAGVTEVLFHPVTYTTTVNLPGGSRSFKVSGGLLLPQGIGADKFRGVVTYFQGTTFNKARVGSDYLKNGSTQLVAEVFASQGYAVVIPDLIGQGVDWADVHPYVLYPQVSAKTAVDMLNAVSSEIKDTYKVDTAKLFSAGYSEGGAYSIWFASYLKSAETGTLNSMYQFKHAVGMAGAYDTATVMKGFLFDNVSIDGGNSYNIQEQFTTNMFKPLLSSVAFLSYATYGADGATNSVFNPDFHQMNCSGWIPQSHCNVGNTHMNISQAMSRQDAGDQVMPILFSALGKSANGATYPRAVGLLFESANSVKALVSTEIMTTAGQQKLDAALRAADFDATALANGSFSIVSLDKDSVVTPNNFASIKKKYPDKLRNAYLIPAGDIKIVSPLSYQIGSNPWYMDLDHFQGPAYEFLYALNTFNQY